MTTLDEQYCLEPNSGASWQSDRFFCSLQPGHEGPHVAYNEHNVTGSGKDVVWLGPWRDKRPYEGEQADRFYEEWLRR